MALNLGPDSKITQSLDSFIREIEDDFSSPHQSTFQSYMPKVKRDIQSLEEGLSNDKSYVRKLTSTLKEVVRTGEIHGSAVTAFADELVKFGTATSATEPEIGNAFVKFGMLFNQTASLLGNLMSSTKSMIFYSLNVLFENELKGAKYKSNINNLYGQYESTRNQMEKEEKRQMQQMGLNPQEKVFSAEEMAGKLMGDRRKFQLGVCEYLIKVLDVRNKRGIDFADHLVGYYQGAQENYFKDGSKLLLAMQQWETRLTTQLAEIRSKNDKEKKRLNTVRDQIRKDLGIDVINAGITQVDPSANTGLTEKSGYLAKKPENVLRLTRRQWPKRYCTVSKNGFTMAHSHTHAPHVRIPVMLFQFKEGGDTDGRKFCFKLQAQTRVYLFDAESEAELQQWRQVMTNCQLELFGGDTITTPKGGSGELGRPLSSPTTAGDTRQLVKRIIAKIQCLPGNDRCCECGAPDPEWLSVNLGVLICIHCSGRHRQLGVQYSRIRSLKLDALKTSELLIARVMGNSLLNEVMEANLTDPKPPPDADMEQRREFIVEKYTNRKYIERQIEPAAFSQELLEAVELRDIRHLLQVYAEGADLKAPLLHGHTALHIAIEQEDLTSLHMIDFILGNSRSGNQADEEDGNTPLHIATLTDNPQCIKLLLNHGASVGIKNKEGKTPLDIAEEKKFDDCLELLQDAVKNKFTKCEHIDIDWGANELSEDESIYQVPVDLTGGNSGGGMKRSETADNILGNSSNGGQGNLIPGHLIGGNPSSAANSPRVTRSQVSVSKRPVSQYIHVKSHASTSGGGHALTSDGGHAPTSAGPFVPSQPNMFPPPTEAPPPPPRTVSQNTSPLPTSPTSIPVVPKRKKRITMMVAPREEEVQPPPSPPVVSTSQQHCIVTALYSCDPDRPDELEFKEGQRIVVTQKVNKDWWRGYIEGQPGKKGIFPLNYVQELDI